MSLLSALSNHLLINESLSVLVGTRVYAEKMPASTSTAPNVMPLLTYKLLDEPVITTHGNNNLYQARVQLDAWGGSYKSAHAVANVIQNMLQGYRGVMYDKNGNSVDVGGFFRKEKRDDPNEDVELFRVVQVYTINYKE